ncbi:MAG TPA: anhydro-N-acetylmuramic acid kinase [Terriglobia bacterium]|nr:anhydro-N-acetylmuramic acid kinase [Terriglobia bacterium]
MPSAAPRLLVGLMAGTSLDGVDAALVRIAGPATAPRVRLLKFVSIPYSPGVRRRLLRIAAGHTVPAGEISQLNFLLGALFADATIELCRKAGITPGNLAGIGSHGQTIFHQGTTTVEAGHKVSSTFQIAEPAVIAGRTGATVVSSFRTADVAAGGQGAPLVPLLDYLLLSDRSRGTVALNIGGIANVTVLPAGAALEDVYGFDTGPGNMIMDGLVRAFTGGRRHYDSNGRLAARGKVIEDLLVLALRYHFFRERPPKSAGREQFGEEFVKRFFLSRLPGARKEDLLRTANELTAAAVAGALRQFVFPRVDISRLIVSGGGAHNRLLMKRISEQLPEIKLLFSDAFGLPVDAKEAIAFAILADRTLHGLPGSLPAVTGARKAVVLGTTSRP